MKLNELLESRRNRSPVVDRQVFINTEKSGGSTIITLATREDGSNFILCKNENGYDTSMADVMFMHRGDKYDLAEQLRDSILMAADEGQDVLQTIKQVTGIKNWRQVK